ncbi:DUF502 domain-containing protein [Lutibacter sp.]|uniref:DUF502 domain-containing protein n=1 Tax=Lutibacter sp. TaxID=1925666 RepID=UPI002732AD78|nr:DUF502 domain-containing protein [Lutibacter sp.]MDP3313933.1 DUF502 domain-containing protein [Lutibacter sp.]
MKKIIRKLINYFLEGLLYIAPLGVTAYVIYSVFTFIDGLLQKQLVSLIGFEIPGLGILTLLLFLILVGFIGRTFIAQPLKVLFKKVIERVPLLNFVYSAFNDLFSAFVGKEKKFNKPVLVKVNSITDLEKLGFITAKNLEIIDELDKVAVYFPHSYNFSGELFIVPKANVKPLNVNSSDLMKFIVSAGLTGLGKNTEEIQ